MVGRVSACPELKIKHANLLVVVFVVWRSLLPAAQPPSWERRGMGARRKAQPQLSCSGPCPLRDTRRWPRMPFWDCMHVVQCCRLSSGFCFAFLLSSWPATLNCNGCDNSTTAIFTEQATQAHTRMCCMDVMRQPSTRVRRSDAYLSVMTPNPEKMSSFSALHAEAPAAVLDHQQSYK